jgi:hypothetical protein
MTSSTRVSSLVVGRGYRAYEDSWKLDESEKLISIESMDEVEEKMELTQETVQLEGPLLMRWKDVMKYVMNWDKKIDYSCWYAVLDWAMNDRVVAFRLLKLPHEDRTMLKESHHVMCRGYQSTPISTNLPIKIRSDILWET